MKSTPIFLKPPQESCNQKVLIVDDEPKNRELLRAPLEARGYEIVEAENGGEALKSLVLEMPDVVLLDLMMPGMNGLEVCRRIKSDPLRAMIPVLIVTALSDRKERLLGIEAGANDFVTKPVDMTDLLMRVRNGCYVRQLFRQLDTERQRSEQLLGNMLPGPIIERMKAGETNIADLYEEASVLVCDLAGFSVMSAHVPPQELVNLLNELFTDFDALVEARACQKIKTNGDSYMVAAGLNGSRKDHVEALAELGLAMFHSVGRFNFEYNTSLGIRIAVATGPVVAGVIGRSQLAFDIWGEVVNAAWRIEGIAATGSLVVSESAYARLKGTYNFAPQTRCSAHGIGFSTYRLLSRA